MMARQNLLTSLSNLLSRKWQQMLSAVQRRNDAAVAAWGASLQYKRRFTNPEDAKRFRKR